MSERSRNIALGAATVTAVGALAAASLEHKDSGNANHAERPVDKPDKVAYVEPNSTVNPSFKVDGKTYRWFTPAADRTIQIEEDGHGGLRAEDAAGDPVNMDLQLPAHGTQTTASEQQAQDPNAVVQVNLPESERYTNSAHGPNGQPVPFRDAGGRIQVVEDGHGGLRAENQEGSPVSGVDIHLPTSEPAPQGPDKNANLTPLPPAAASGPNPPPNGILREVN